MPLHSRSSSRPASRPPNSRRVAHAAGRVGSVLAGLLVIGSLAIAVPQLSTAGTVSRQQPLAAPGSTVAPGTRGPGAPRPYRSGVVEMGVDGLPAPAATSGPPSASSRAASGPASAGPASTAPTAAASRAPAPAATADATAEGQVLALVNQQRASAGCAPLVANGALAALARAHSADMRDRNFFSHTNPDGLDPFQRAAAAGITTMRAENIAQGQADPAAVMTAWMNSPGHRANILDCSLRTLGVGVAYGTGGPWWTQDFGV